MLEYDVQIEGYVRVEAASEAEARDRVRAELPSFYIGDTLVETEVGVVNLAPQPSQA